MTRVVADRGANLRLDLEGGVANVPSLGERAWVPHLAAGISYAFPVELSPGEPLAASGTVGAPAAGAACTTTREPDPDGIAGVIRATVNDWILSARYLRQRLHGPELQVLDNERQADRHDGQRGRRLLGQRPRDPERRAA